jgi:hypothetical protein
MATSLRKTRSKDNPYEIWEDARTGWRWDVLKFYKSRENTIADPYGRVFCNVHGDYTEMGDVYYADIRSNAVLIRTAYLEA